MYKIFKSYLINLGFIADASVIWISDDNLKSIYSTLNISHNLMLSYPNLIDIINNHTITNIQETYIETKSGLKYNYINEHNNNYLETDTFLLNDIDYYNLKYYINNQRLSVLTFNLGHKIISNEILGSEASKVSQCQLHYSSTSGWYKNLEMSSCSKNAFDLVSQYKLIGLQEMNIKYQDSSIKYLKNLNPYFEFLSSIYLTNCSLLTIFDIRVTGPGILITLSNYNFLSRGIQASWFKKINLLFINLHAPHEIQLKSELECCLKNIERNYGTNINPERIIIVGDFNDDKKELFNDCIFVFGRYARISGVTPNSCCYGDNYKYVGDYIFDTEVTSRYYGFPPDYIRETSLMSDHDPIVMIEDNLL